MGLVQKLKDMFTEYDDEYERTTEDEAYLLYSINLDTIEVIGNIYKNKELLNETNR